MVYGKCLWNSTKKWPKIHHCLSNVHLFIFVFLLYCIVYSSHSSLEQCAPLIDVTIAQGSPSYINFTLFRRIDNVLWLPFINKVTNLNKPLAKYSKFEQNVYISFQTLTFNVYILPRECLWGPTEVRTPLLNHWSTAVVLAFFFFALWTPWTRQWYSLDSTTKALKII